MCKGAGYLIKTVDGYDIAEECECRKFLVRDARISFANIPEAFKDMRLETFSGAYYQDKESLKTLITDIKYWLSHVDEVMDAGMGLYLYSHTKGSGKTRMAVSLANELIIEHGKRVLFVTSLDILSEIRAMWNRESREDSEFRSESQIMRYLNETEILVVDDFGTEAHKEWMDDRFYQIINTRYINKLLTIFTSNYSIKELKYDDRIINRINERSYEIHFPEESVRDVLAQVRKDKMRKEIRDNG